MRNAVAEKLTRYGLVSYIPQSGEVIDLGAEMVEHSKQMSDNNDVPTTFTLLAVQAYFRALLVQVSFETVCHDYE